MSDAVFKDVGPDGYEVTIPGVCVWCEICGARHFTFLKLDETEAQMEARAKKVLDAHHCVPSYSVVITGFGPEKP